MGSVKLYLAVCGLAVLLGLGESKIFCGIEITYTGFNPIEALRLIQQREMQEYDQFRSIISDLKFKLQSEDYFAWKRCLSEYEKEKAKFMARAGEIKTTFLGLVQNLMSQKLNAAQQEAELQKLLQQFESQFSPAVQTFKTNIQNLLDTIQDANKRKTWWSTIKTSTVTTEADGSTTRTSLTETKSSSSGGGESGYFGKVRSAAGGLLEGSASVLSKSASYISPKQGGYGDSNSQSEESFNGQSGGSFSAQSVEASQSKRYGSSSQTFGKYENQQRSGLSGDNEGNDESSQSGYDGITLKKSKEVKEETSYQGGASDYDTDASQSGYGVISKSKEVKREETYSKRKLGINIENDGTEESGSETGFESSGSSKKRMCECS